jgi:predicted porin
MDAKAADLGGGCCADLEERVADLEATTARKGNRKVSLEVSGQVNKALMVWDDGKDSDAYIVDNLWSSTRLRFKGTGQMMPGWKAGFYMEYEFRDNGSQLVDQTRDNSRTNETALRIRQENVFVDSEKFGRVTLGHQNSSTKDLTLINISGALSDPEDYHAASFFVRDSGLGRTAGQGGVVAQSSRLTWNNLSNALDGQRLQLIRYDTPSIFGFILSAAWGENDFWDVALRYQKEWNSFRIAGGIGYAYYGDADKLLTPTGLAATQAQNGGCTNIGSDPAMANGPCTKTEVISGTVTAMHMPTGLYATFVAGQRHLETPSAAVAAVGNPDASYWYTQFGITKRFFEVGATTFYGEYGSYQDFAAGASYDGTLTGPAIRVTSSDTTRWGLGFTQAFDSAALELYTNYLHYSADIGATCTTANAAMGCAAAGSSFSSRPEDMQIVYSGMRLKF